MRIGVPPDTPGFAETLTEYGADAVPIERSEAFDGVIVPVTGSVDGASRLARLRETLVAEVPIIGLLPARANVAPELVATCDALVIPRLSGGDGMREAVSLAVRAARGEVRPTMAAVHLPLTLGDAGPWELIDALADDQLVMPLLLANGVALGGSHGDVKDRGVTVVVVTDHDVAFARNLADDLAQAIWDARAELTHGEVPGRDTPGRRRPMWPFEPEAAWAGATFGG